MPEYITDGDQGFIGVNMSLDPALLEPGHAAEAINKRFKDGVATTRPGIKKLSWSNKAESDYENKTYSENEFVRFSGRKAVSITSNPEAFDVQKVTDGMAFTSGYDFGADPGGWTEGAGWDIDETNNKATHTPRDSSDSNITRTVGTQEGHDYVVTFTIVGSSAGTIEPFLGGVNSVDAVQGNGTYSIRLTATGTNSLSADKLSIQASHTFDGSVKDVKINEPAQVQITNTTGPASNPYAGPYFRRTNVATHTAPVSSLTINSGVENWSISSSWEDLGSRIFAYATVYGVGVFNDPEDTEYVIVATADGIYAAREGMLSFKLPGQASVDRSVTLVQAFSQMIMFRGSELEPLIMENIQTGFVSIAQTDSDLTIDDNDFDGTDQIPNASTGIYFQNRLLIPHSRDLVAASDYLNVTRYQPVLSNFRINQGSEDELVALHKFDASTVLCFKSNSIYMVRNIYGNLTDIVLDELTSAYGCFAAKSIVSVGRDVWFLSEKRGICSLGITQSGAVQGVDKAVSEPIQPIIDRINWNYAHNAVSAYHNNRFYCALPIDGSSSLNCVAVYDFANGSWSGIDEGFTVKEFVQPKISGRKRLCFLDQNNTISLYDDDDFGGLKDESVNTTAAIAASTNRGKTVLTAISDKLVTRGYNLKNMERKRWHSARVCTQSLNPSFTVRALVDGVEENEIVKGPITFDRSKYDKPFYQADFVTSNVNQDFNTKYRQDYSIMLTSDSDALWLSKDNADGAGVYPDQMQEAQNKVRLKQEGRYIQIDVRNTQGKIKVNSVLVDGLQKSMNINKEL